jgi:hypothetical protein
LQADACLLNNLHESARGAIKARRFRRIDFDLAVVDPQARKSREYMFDQGDMFRLMSECRAPGSSRNLFDIRGNDRARTQIRAQERDAGGWGRWLQAQANRGAGQETNAVDFHGTSERSLIAVA